MGQQKNTNLKAYVRFDGTGRVVPSSLILQRFKPKDGNWQEINATECCSDLTTTTTTSTSTSTTTSTSTSTTTTTSTSTSTTTTTTTAAPTVYNFIGGFGYGSTGEACFAGMTQTYYSTTPYGSVTNGSVLYADSGLTTPITYPFVALTGLGIVFSCSNGVLSNQANC